MRGYPRTNKYFIHCSAPARNNWPAKQEPLTLNGKIMIWNDRQRAINERDKLALLFPSTQYQVCRLDGEPVTVDAVTAL